MNEKVIDGNSVSLKEYFDTKIESLEKATVVAASGMEKRLEGMNEFRDQLKDQTSTFVVRSEHDAIMARVNEDIRILRESKAKMDGKASQLSTNIATAIAIVGLVLSLLGVFRNNLTPFNGNPPTPAPSQMTK